MDYKACLRHLKSTMNPRRQGLVAALYEKLQESDCVPISVMKSSFDAKNSPMCMLGAKDAASATREFFEALDYFSGSSDAFTPDGFADFFAMVSGVHQEDQEFDLMTTAAFGLPLG